MCLVQKLKTFNLVLFDRQNYINVEKGKLTFNVEIELKGINFIYLEKNSKAIINWNEPHTSYENVL